MTCNDIVEAIKDSNFTDKNFQEELKICGNKISHPCYIRTGCSVINDICYANAGCVLNNTRDGSVNECLNIVKLPPNSKFIVDEGTFEYFSDEIGRVKFVQAHITKLISRTDPGNYNLQRAEKKNNKYGDDGGHIIAKCLGGPNEAINIVPINRNKNNLIREFEIGLKSFIDNNCNLEYSVFLEYPDDNSLRPSRLTYNANAISAIGNFINLCMSIDNF